MIRSQEIIREGRDAIISARFHGEATANPYRKGTKRAFWWEWGADRARRAADALWEIGA